MNVLMITSGYEGCNYVRMYLPGSANGFRMDKPNRFQERTSPQQVQEDLKWAEVVVFHRAEEQTYHNLAKLLKKDGKKVIMDNDDTFKIEELHPLMNFDPEGTFQTNLKRRFDNLNEFLTMSDMVTASTEILAEEYRAFNKNVVVLPNCVDPDHWDEPLRNDTDKVRIGMVGSVAMEYDYLHLKDIIKGLGERDDVELVMFGLGNMKHRQDNPRVTEVFKEEYEFWDTVNMEHFPWVKNHLYPETLNEMRLDMMLIPRRDNYFNRCKSNLKFLEAAMCEIPVIAQSFKNGPYEEITDDTGILIKDNKDWAKEIETMIKDKELRRLIGSNAKKYVLKNYDIKDHAHKWVDAYKSLF